MYVFDICGCLCLCICLYCKCVLVVYNSMNEEREGKERLQWPLLHLVMAIQVSCSAVTTYVCKCDDAWAVQWAFTVCLLFSEWLCELCDIWPRIQSAFL